MGHLSSVAVVTTPGARIELSAQGLKVDPLRVLLMTEADYILAMKAIDQGGLVECNSAAMPLLSSDRPTLILTPPSAGAWRIVYQTEDVESLVAKAKPSHGRHASSERPLADESVT